MSTSVEQTGSVTCVLRRDGILTYIHVYIYVCACVCVCVCVIYRITLQCRKFKTIASFKTGPCHKLATFQTLVVTQALECVDDKRDAQSCYQASLAAKS